MGDVVQQLHPLSAAVSGWGWTLQHQDQNRPRINKQELSTGSSVRPQQVTGFVWIVHTIGKDKSHFERAIHSWDRNRKSIEAASQVRRDVTLLEILVHVCAGKVTGRALHGSLCDEFQPWLATALCQEVCQGTGRSTLRYVLLQWCAHPPAHLHSAYTNKQGSLTKTWEGDTAPAPRPAPLPLPSGRDPTLTLPLMLGRMILCNSSTQHVLPSISFSLRLTRLLQRWRQISRQIPTRLLLPFPSPTPGLA